MKRPPFSRFVVFVAVVWIGSLLASGRAQEAFGVVSMLALAAEFWFVDPYVDAILKRATDAATARVATMLARKR